jgi:hypothetical protein
MPENTANGMPTTLCRNFDILRSRQNLIRRENKQPVNNNAALFVAFGDNNRGLYQENCARRTRSQIAGIGQPY